MSSVGLTVDSDDYAKMSCTLLVCRIVFHANLLVIYPVFVVYAFTFANIQSVLGAALLVVILLLLACDWITLHRRVPAFLWIVIDMALMGALIILCIMVDSYDWFFAGDSSDPKNFNVWQELVWDSYTFYRATILIPVVVGVLYLLFLVIMSCRNWKMDGHLFRRFFATQTTLSAPRPRGSSPLRWIAGRRRSEEEKNVVKQKCTQAFFRHSVFRKHPFEPALLGLVRGLVATWAALGLLGYLVFLVCQQQTTASSTSTVNRSLVSINSLGFDKSTSQTVYFGSDNPEIFVETNSDTQGYYGPTLLEANVNITVPDAGSEGSPCHLRPNGSTTLNCSLSATTDDESTTADDEGPYPRKVRLNSIHLSFVGDFSVSVWILDSIHDQTDVFPIARQYTDPFILQPNTHLVGSVTVTKKEYGKWKWIVYTPRVSSDTNSSDIGAFTSNTSSLDLDSSLPTSTEWIISEEIVAASIAGEALKIISTVGGIHVVVNGIFFLIFGRSLLAVLFGGKPLSPFGVSGLFPSFRHAIHKHYPAMEDDLKARGMARFVEEVAMDIGVLRMPKRRSNVESSPETTASNDSAEMQPLRVPGEDVERSGGTD